MGHLRKLVHFAMTTVERGQTGPPGESEIMDPVDRTGGAGVGQTRVTGGALGGSVLVVYSRDMRKFIYSSSFYCDEA